MRSISGRATLRAGDHLAGCTASSPSRAAAARLMVGNRGSSDQRAELLDLGRVCEGAQSGQAAITSAPSMSGRCGGGRHLGGHRIVTYAHHHKRPPRKRARAASKLFSSVIIVALALVLSACSLDAYPCRGPYGEPCGGPRSGWPGAVTCPSC
jgi:hypothetical protein